MRVVFCMFADDAGVFEPRDIFLDFIETRTGEDGADLGPWLAQLFEVLDTPEDQRPATLDEDLARFPYVNGDLFKGLCGRSRLMRGCAGRCWTPAASIGQTSRPRSSARSSSRSWIRWHAAPILDLKLQ